MEDKIKALDRELIIKAVKTLVYFIPIIGITNKLYILKYGAYHISFDYLTEFIEKYNNRILFSFLVFAGVFGVALVMERYVIPILAIIKFGKDNLDPDAKMKAQKFFNKLHGITIHDTFDHSKRIRMFVDKSFIVVLVALWFIYIGTIWSYLVLLLWFYIAYRYFKGINGFFDEVNTPQDTAEDTESRTQSTN